MNLGEAKPVFVLPRGVKTAAIITLVLGGLVTLFSLNEMMSLFALSDLKEQAPKLTMWGDPAMAQKAFLAEMAALEQMRGARSFTLLVLSFASCLTFAAAARLLRPRGLSRERMRRLLVGSCLVTAILSTIDGAEFAVVMRAVAHSVGGSLVKVAELPDPQQVAQLQQMIPLAFVGWVFAVTLVVGGLFAGLSVYFRSERVRQVLQEQ